MQPDQQTLQPARRGCRSWEIPGLSEIPILGPALFNGNIFCVRRAVLVVVVHIALFRTRWGLRTRAVGEHPAAADTVGVKVLGLRYRNVLLGGLVAGLRRRLLHAAGHHAASTRT